MKKRKANKLKIKKSLKRRFKITKTGKIMRRGSHNRHLKRRKNKGQVRKQNRPQTLEGKLKNKIKKALGK